jgi:uncharacterized protein YidB (DUF937 family)
MGLLDAVIGMLGNQGQGSSAGLGGGGGQIDLMRIVAALLANRDGGGGGGIGGLIEQFQRSGMGDVIGSWVSKGQNLPISPDQLSQVFGSSEIDSLSQQTGLSQGDLLSQLSQVLPQMVDRATPEGQVPEGGLGDIGAILSRFG